MNDGWYDDYCVQMVMKLGCGVIVPHRKETLIMDLQVSLILHSIAEPNLPNHYIVS